jgi:hypothetical protein
VTSLLDQILPHYDVHEVHRKLVPAPPARTYAAAEGVTGREVRLAAPLMALRGIPGRLRGRPPRPDNTVPLLQSFERGGFIRLGEDPGREVVLGAVGRFWQVSPEVVALSGPDEFRDFCEPGYARVAFNLLVTPDGRQGSCVRTETRVAGTDPHGSRMFRRYWVLIRAGSGLIRHSWLAAIGRRASDEGPALVH